MDRLVLLSYYILAAVVAMLLIAAALAFINRHRLRRKPQLPDERRYELQADLLEWIKAKSANQRTVVDIRPFWRGRSVKVYQREAVVQPLIKNGDVSVHHTPLPNEFLETLHDWAIVAFCLPPTHLALRDRTWTWMVHERISGRNIVFERVETLNWQNAGRDIRNSPQTNAGRDAKVRFDHVVSTGGNEGIPVESLTDLIAALREDAASLEDPEERSKVRTLANKLGDETDQDKRDEDAIEDSIARAERYVSRTGGLMTATHKVLETWQQMRGQS